MLISGQHSERYGFVVRLLEFARAGHPDAVAKDQEAYKQPGIKPGTPATGAVVGGEDLGKIQRLHDIQDEIGRMSLLQPIQKVRREKQRLPRLVAEEFGRLHADHFTPTRNLGRFPDRLLGSPDPLGRTPHGIVSSVTSPERKGPRPAPGSGIDARADGGGP